MRADGRVVLALLAAVVATAPARAADVAPAERAARDVETLTARGAILTEQADAAWTSARWRARALYRVVVVGEALALEVRARVIDAGTRALARDLAEARTLRAARDELHVTRDALASVARADEVIGAAPAFSLPVPGAALARFGVAPEHITGVLVGRAGVRLAALAGAAVRAPAAGAVARVAAEPAGTTVVLDHGAGWTTIVGGLADVDLAVGPGDHVAAGQRLGAAAGAVAFEIWRGRHAVDPLLLARPASAALAAPAHLP